MGIQGLISFLEKSSRPVNISQFSGCTVAVDAYSWLHKGTFSCADKLARGEPCDAYVHYCIKYVNMLLSHNIKPILVFDGRHLPAKAETEKKRRESRELNRKRAAELMRLDKPNEARTFLRRCIDVTHDMALALMRECRARNIDCITAPYEADAQLAYLNIINIAHIVITEDSDLVVFGCSKVIFKLDLNGGGLLVEQDKLHLAMGVHKDKFSMEKFRQMCILSGCDYLASLPGIGLAKASRFIKRTAEPDIHKALTRLGGHLNMNLVTPIEYRDKFVEAEAMFMHQPVFDPIKRCVVPLTPVTSGAPSLPLLDKDNLPPDQAYQLALGNLDPFTLQVVDSFDPDNPQARNGKSRGWNGTLRAPHKSIWSADYKPVQFVIKKPEPQPIKHVSTVGQKMQVDVSKKIPVQRPQRNCSFRIASSMLLPSAMIAVSSAKVAMATSWQTGNEELLAELQNQLGIKPEESVMSKIETQFKDDVKENIHISPVKKENSPVKLDSAKKHFNPFVKKTPNKEENCSNTIVSALSKFSKIKRTIIDENCIIQSRYFGSSTKTAVNEDMEINGHPEKEKESVFAKKNLTLKDLSTNILTNSDVSKTHNISSMSQGNSFHINKSPKKRSLLDAFGSVEESNVKRNSVLMCSDEKLSVFTSEETTKCSSREDHSKNKTSTTFKWAKSFEERFGFRNSQIKSSIASNNDFRIPSRTSKEDENNVTEVKNCTEINIRNPFKAKKENDSYSLGSQGSSERDDSFDDCDESSENIAVLPTSNPQEKSRNPSSHKTPACRRIGLSKKTSGGQQQSLLSMFAFQAKTKI